MAEGPIDELLAGSEGVIYEITLKGDTEPALKRARSLPWVGGIKTGEHDGEITWQVSVSDPQAAEMQLLKMLVDTPAVVTEFRRKRYELEDIFIQVIEGDRDVRK